MNTLQSFHLVKCLLKVSEEKEIPIIDQRIMKMRSKSDYICQTDILQLSHTPNTADLLLLVFRKPTLTQKPNIDQ